jgi:hypothetical protein
LKGNAIIITIRIIAAAAINRLVGTFKGPRTKVIQAILMLSATIVDILLGPAVATTNLGSAAAGEAIPI